LSRIPQVQIKREIVRRFVNVYIPGVGSYRVAIEKLEISDPEKRRTVHSAIVCGGDKARRHRQASA
jgi:hypothetical protein